jgi:hypothetical protein
MNSSQLQSLSRRLKTSIASVHERIASAASFLLKMGPSCRPSTRARIAEINRPIYSELSKLQRERKKLEDLQAAVKLALAAAVREEQACRVLNRAGLYDLQVVDLKASRPSDEV